MHSTLTELLENLKPGLLWVGREGVVRYANGDASVRTGLAPGCKLYDPGLARAVSAAIAGRVTSAVTSTNKPAQAGGAPSELQCRVIPGLTAEDAFVLISPEAHADHGLAFDNLMQVIRSDVQEPLAHAQAALSCANGAGADDHALHALCASVEEILQILQKLVDLAGVWGSSSLLAVDRIELWPLLQQGWGEIEPLAIERSVKARFHAQGAKDQLATIYGSEPWLKRVFVECMEAAVRASRRGASIEIEHRQLGTRAVIVFRDTGVFAPVNQEGVELASTSNPPKAPMAPRLHARDQIGLKLCRHIVSLHGGQLREENEDGMRNFLIDLPTGAPHNNDQSQLDIAQAQQYAQDLAALMARARSAKALSGSNPKA